MALASDLIAINSQSKNQVQVAKFKITYHLNYLLNRANWSPMSSDPNDHNRAYPKSEQERLIVAINEEYAELEQVKALGKFNMLKDGSEFDVLEFYSSEKNRLFGQYSLDTKKIIVNCSIQEPAKKTLQQEKTESDEIATLFINHASFIHKNPFFTGIKPSVMSITHLPNAVADVVAEYAVDRHALILAFKVQSVMEKMQSAFADDTGA